MEKKKLTPDQIKALMKQTEKAIRSVSADKLEKEIYGTDQLLNENQGDYMLHSLKKKIQQIRTQRHGRK